MIKPRRMRCAKKFGGEARRKGRPRPIGKKIKIIGIQDGVVWSGLIWLRIWTSGGPFVNTLMNLRVAEKVLEQLRDWRLSPEGLSSMEWVLGLVCYSTIAKCTV
jgi:hypothetical protein